MDEGTCLGCAETTVVGGARVATASRGLGDEVYPTRRGVDRDREVPVSSTVTSNPC